MSSEWFSTAFSGFAFGFALANFLHVAVRHFEKKKETP